MDRAKLHAWLTTQIGDRLPPNTLEAGVGQSIQELAVALRGLEGGGGTIFGMTVGGEDLAPLAARARAALEAWRARLAEERGDEGVAIVTTIAARCGVLLDLVPLAARVTSPAVAALVATLADRAALDRIWRTHGSLDDEIELGVRIEVGTPDETELAELIQIAREASELELPASYIELLRTYNGIAVFAAEVPVPTDLVWLDPTQLSEPVIWPTHGYGDHFQLQDVPLDGIEHAFVFGELTDMGPLFLDASGRAPVFWLPRRFFGDGPVELAASFDEFLTAFSRCGANLPVLLRQLEVPGWGE